MVLFLVCVPVTRICSLTLGSSTRSRFVEMQVDRVVFKEVPIEVEKIRVKVSIMHSCAHTVRQLQNVDYNSVV
jgi:hypothetical protein